MKYTVELDYDEVGEIVRKELIDAYENALSATHPDDVKWVKRLKKMIKYYSTQEQWQEFKDGLQ